jgi:Uma2 family endonuclease
MLPTTDEIVLPITEPETEWIAGRAVRKVSPTNDHGTIQRVLAAHLGTWAHGRGRVACERRFRITPRGEVTRPLVPDVAYLSYERAAGMTRAQFQVPVVAPDIVVEVLSPDDRPTDVESKCRDYLAADVRLVVVVDPEARTVLRIDADGTAALVDADTATMAAFPGLTLPYGDALFSVLDEGFGPDGRIAAPDVFD